MELARIKEMNFRDPKANNFVGFNATSKLTASSWRETIHI
jgi:hypothetical protein